MSYHYHVQLHRMPADMLTPVSVFLALRDIYPNTLLLESSDYHHKERSYSYICCMPVAGIEVQAGLVRKYLPGGAEEEVLPDPQEVLPVLSSFIGSFSFDPVEKPCTAPRFFGHINYDAVAFFEQITFRDQEQRSIPDIRFHLYRYVIVFDHFYHTAYLAIQYKDGESIPATGSLIAALQQRREHSAQFVPAGQEAADTTDETFMEMVRQAKHHCNRGDVFQMVLSRRFSLSVQR